MEPDPQQLSVSNPASPPEESGGTCLGAVSALLALCGLCVSLIVERLISTVSSSLEHRSNLSVGFVRETYPQSIDISEPILRGLFPL